MSLYLRAAIGLVPWYGRPKNLPDTELTRRATVDRQRLADYNRVCGFRLTDTLPPTYPHVMAFPLAMHLMSASNFPFPVVGLVHVGNRIELRRPIDAAEPLDLAVRAADLRPHDRGRQFDVIATASVEGEVVWRGVSTYLHRKSSRRSDSSGPSSSSGSSGPSGPSAGVRGERAASAPPAASARWRVEPRVGTDYARVSGDHNPIHTSRLGARLFGFARPIAHGMWSKARCLAALEGRLPDAYTVDVAFKLPIFLPSTVAFSATPAWSFSLRNAKSAKPHLSGTVTP